MQVMNQDTATTFPLDENIQPASLEGLVPQMDSDLAPQGDPALITPLSEDQAADAAEMFSVATGREFNSMLFTSPSIFENAAKEVVRQLQGEERELRRQTLIEAASDPRLSLEARTELVRALANESQGIDGNMIDRAAMSALASEELRSMPSDFAEEAALQAMEQVESLPRTITPQYSDSVPLTEVQLSGYGLGEEIRQLREQAELNERGSDVFGQLIPGATQTLAYDVAKAAELDFSSFSIGVGATLSPGSVLNGAARKLEMDAMDAGFIPDVNGQLKKDVPREVKEAFYRRVQNVLDVLKNNSGMISDVNNTTIIYALDELFPKFLRDEYVVPEFQEVADERTIQNLQERKVYLERRIAEFNGDRHATFGFKQELEQVNARIAGLTPSLLETHPTGGIPFVPTIAREITANQWVDAATAITDLALVGDAFRVLKGGVKLISNRMSRANRVAPNTTANAAASTLSTGAVNPITKGTLPEDMLDAMLPSVSARNNINSNVNIGPVIARVDEDLATAAMENVNRIVLTEGETAQAVEVIRSRLVAGTNAAPAKLNLSNSTLTPIKTAAGDDGLEVAGVFGRTEQDAFGSVEDALSAARALFGSEAPIRVLKYEADNGGRLVDAAETVAGGKYYFSTRTVVPYETVTDFNQALVFGQKAITPGIANRFWWSMFKRGTGFNPLGYKSSVFNDFFSKHINVANTKGAALSRMLTMRIEDALKLAKGKENEVAILLEKIQNKAGTLTRSDLDELGAQYGFAVTDQMAASVFTYRRAMDVLYRVADSYAARVAMQEGLEEVWSDAGRLGFGKRLPKLDKPQNIYDMATGAVTRMDAADVNTLIGSGRQLVELQRGAKASGTRYVLVGGKGSIRPLSGRGILNYIPGYIPKVAEAPYVVYAFKGNSETLLGVAANKLDAAKLAERLQTTSDPNFAKRFAGYTFAYKFDASSRAVGEAGALGDQVLQNLGGLVFGQRNADELINGSPDLLPTIYLDPFTAAIKAADAVAFSVTKNDMIRQLSDRMLNTIRARTGIERTALTDDLVDELIKKGFDDLASEAKAVLAQVSLTRGMPDSAATFGEMFFRQIEKGITKVLDNKIGRELASYAANKAVQGGFSPLRAMSRFLHTTVVATAFTLQNGLQFFQPLLLIGLTPRGITKAYATQMAMLTLGISRASENAFLNFAKSRVARMEKLLGYDKGEIYKLVKAMENRGVYDAVDVDTRIRGFARNKGTEIALLRAQKAGTSIYGGAIKRRAAKLGGATGMATETALRGIETAGFTFGEKINQQLTFLALYNADKVAGKANIASRKYLDDLVARTREVTGTMNPEDSFAFQRGIFKTMFNFASFPFKMVKLTAPEFAGGTRVFTLPEKGRIVAGQFVLYGMPGMVGGGYMLKMFNDHILANAPTNPEERSAFEQFWFSENVQGIISGGIIDYGINFGFRNIMGGEDTNLEISQRFAPLGGAEFVARSFVDPFLNPENKNAVEMWLGMPGAQLSKTWEVIKEAGMLMMAQLSDVHGINFQERWEYLAKKGAATLIAQYRREYALLLHDQADGFVMAGGNVSQETMNDFERTAFRLFGIDTTNRAEYYALRNEYMDRWGGMSTEERDEEASQYASTYFSMLMDFNRQRMEENLPEDQRKMLLEDWIETQTYLTSAVFNDDADMLRRVQDKLYERVIKTIEAAEEGTATSVEKQLVDAIITKLNSNVLDDPRLAVNQLLESSTLTPEQKALIESKWLDFVEDNGEP